MGETLDFDPYKNPQGDYLNVKNATLYKQQKRYVYDLNTREKLKWEN